MSIQDLNYFNDHRVRAASQKPWFVHNDRGCVAVRVRTADWHWLDAHGYDPEEFDGGLKPMVYQERVVTDRDCWRCRGAGEMLRHREWQGITLPAGDPELCSDEHWVNKWRKEPEMFDRIPCWDACCVGGKETRWQSFPDGKGVIDPDAEDRKYFPFRVHVFPCVDGECDTCDGTGRHVNPSIDAGGISSEEFDHDPGFAEMYFSGAFDVRCYGCGGSGKVPVIDVDEMCEEDKAVYAVWREWQDEIERDEAAYRAERAAEIRWGC